jgi:hypothetical protein
MIRSSAGKYQHQYAILATLAESDIEHPIASGLSTPITIHGWQQRPSNRRYSIDRSLSNFLSPFHLSHLTD